MLSPIMWDSQEYRELTADIINLTNGKMTPEEYYARANKEYNDKPMDTENPYIKQGRLEDVPEKPLPAEYLINGIVATEDITGARRQEKLATESALHELEGVAQEIVPTEYEQVDQVLKEATIMAEAEVQFFETLRKKLQQGAVPTSIIEELVENTKFKIEKEIKGEFTTEMHVGEEGQGDSITTGVAGRPITDDAEWKDRQRNTMISELRDKAKDVLILANRASSLEDIQVAFGRLEHWRMMYELFKEQHAGSMQFLDVLNGGMFMACNDAVLAVGKRL